MAPTGMRHFYDLPGSIYRLCRRVRAAKCAEVLKGGVGVGECVDCPTGGRSESGNLAAAVDAVG